jgi:hypothetical protein
MRTRREATWLALASPHPSSHWRNGQLVRASEGPLRGRVLFFEDLASRRRGRVVTDLLGGAKASIDIIDLENA